MNGPLSCTVNTIAADVLASQGAMVLAVNVLTYFSWNIPVSAEEELIFFLLMFTHGHVPYTQVHKLLSFNE